MLALEERAASHLACAGHGLKWRDKPQLWVGADPAPALDSGTDMVLQCPGRHWKAGSVAVWWRWVSRGAMRLSECIQGEAAQGAECDANF